MWSGWCRIGFRYEDDLARNRQQTEHELQRRRNSELVKLQEESAIAKERERLAIEQQVQAERRASEQHKVNRHFQISVSYCVLCRLNWKDRFKERRHWLRQKGG